MIKNVAVKAIFKDEVQGAQDKKTHMKAVINSCLNLTLTWTAHQDKFLSIN